MSSSKCKVRIRYPIIADEQNMFLRTVHDFPPVHIVSMKLPPLEHYQFMAQPEVGNKLVLKNMDDCFGILLGINWSSIGEAKISNTSCLPKRISMNYLEYKPESKFSESSCDVQVLVSLIFCLK